MLDRASTRRLLLFGGSLAGAAILVVRLLIGAGSLLRPQPRVTLASLSGQPAYKPDPPFQLPRRSPPSEIYYGHRLLDIPADVLATEAMG